MNAFRTFLVLAALLMLTACARYAAPPYLAPDQRPQPIAEAEWPTNHVLGIGYHSVQDRDPDNRYLSVRTANLILQFNWLRENGYQPVSVDQILTAHDGGTPLPEKAVLLSFDDGFTSFTERVLPILRAYQWPAVLAPVGQWLRTPVDQPVDFGGYNAPREYFLTVEQLREVAASGLVELAVHTDNMHYGQLANPQGNTQPTAASLRYLEDQQRYETVDEFRTRIRADVQQISALIRSVSGRDPRVWVWPYGAASGMALSIIEDEGYQIALTLQPGLSDMSTLEDGARLLIDADPAIDQFARLVANIEEKAPHRVVHVDLDYVYDPDPVQQERNVGLLVQRIADLRPSTVFLQAYADPKGDGTVHELYFPNRHLPMRADLFNRVAWQLRTRANTDIYAWMPVLSYDIPGLPRVLRYDPETGTTAVSPDQYQRLSPFDPRVRQVITEIYEDLSAQANFVGVLFHDDAVMSDFEDAGPAALEAYAKAGLGDSISALRADDDTLWKWTRFKSRYLTDFTLELAQRVRAVRGPQVKTARNIFALPILEPYSETWFAQNLDDFLGAYDWTAPMAMPLMEGVPLKESDAWLAALVAKIAERPGALERTLFELQARDWSSTPNRPVSGEQLRSWIRTLQWHGVRHYGYYPDDFHNDQPLLKTIRPAIANSWSPLP